MSTRSPLHVLLALSAAAAPVGAQGLPDVVGRPIASPVRTPVPIDTVTGQDGRLSAAQLENLVASVALYPDALLAQVLVASTFPDQVSDAASYVRSHGTDGVDDQSWDLSVKAVAHYPSALNTLADKPEWTAALGRAYASQSGDVMRAVQQLRRMADEQGNLVSNQQQQVVREQGNYLITPAQPQLVYVPAYDPVVIYTRPVFLAAPVSRYWSFGVGFPLARGSRTTSIGARARCTTTAGVIRISGTPVGGGSVRGRSFRSRTCTWGRSIARCSSIRRSIAVWSTIG